MSIGSRAAAAGEAAGGGVAVVLLLRRLFGGITGCFRSAACREVGELRRELTPSLAALTADAEQTRKWREHVEGELGYLRGAVETLLDGRSPPPARSQR